MQSIQFFISLTIIYMVHEVNEQYNNYSSMKANQKLIKLITNTVSLVSIG